MADKDGMERKVYLLPTDLVERMRAYQTAEGIPSEVEAARRLLNIALQMRDNVSSILESLEAQFVNEKNMRVLGANLLDHALIETVTVKNGDLTFHMANDVVGQIDRIGMLWTGENENSLQPYRSTRPHASTARVSKAKPSWDADKGGDLDDEIPF